MNYIETTICAGAAQPFRFLHISDQHLALADDRDDPRKRELVQLLSPVHMGAAFRVISAVRK